MKWITREHVKVDRVACPWLIKKFIDKDAEFLFVPTDQVMEVAEREGATPYDVKNVELGHHGKECSFEAILKQYDLTTDAALVLLGVLVTPYFIDVIAPGFKGETRRLTIQLVRIVFPGVGLLVLSAWCLGILNSHGKFFLSYASPVVWNAAFIGVLIVFGRKSDLPHLAVYGAYGLVLGSALQFFIQVPIVLKLAPKLRIFFSSLGKNVRIVLRNFTPVFVSRGVVQLSATVDSILASYLPATAVSSQRGSMAWCGIRSTWGLSWRCLAS